jgi:tetratricopeptide (TPR) repeat protein
MKRIILTGALALAAGITCVAQQAQPAKPAQGQGQQGQQGQQQPQGQPMVPGAKSPGESQAIINLFQQAQSGPDATIKAAEDLLTKYADTTFKDTALFLEADSYQRKNDPEKAQIFAERALEANPKNFQAGLMLADYYALRTRENDLDKEEKLTKAEKYSNDVINTMKTIPKPNPQITDEQWEEGKKQITAQAHRDLGMTAVVRKKYDVAITELKAAYDSDPQPAYETQLASAYLSAGKKDEASALCDKILATPNLHPAIKQAAQNIKDNATKK